MTDAALIAIASLFALMGVLALARPGAVLAQFGVPALPPAGRNEVRAVYGGFGLAVAAVLLASLAAPALRAGVCLTVAVALGGMAAGRLVSAVMDRQLAAAPLAYLVVEVAVGSLLLYAGGLIQAP